MNIVRPAIIPEIPAIMEVLSDGREKMRAEGNVNQWTEGYPSLEIIREDIEKGWGFVVCKDGEIEGYFAFIQGIEPTYSVIYDGEWISDEPYAVIHRMASKHGAHGVFATALAFALENCKNIRIDTHRDNKIMQHNILKHGFRYCGIIYLASGDERLAYQLIKD